MRIKYILYIIGEVEYVKVDYNTLK